MLNWFRRIFAPDKWERTQLQKVEAIKAHMVELSKLCLALRCQGRSEAGRIGWQVSAFIPEEELNIFREMPHSEIRRAALQTYIDRVARRLVEAAVMRLYEKDINGLTQGLCFPELPAYVSEGPPDRVDIRRLGNEWEQFGYTAPEECYYSNTQKSDAKVDAEIAQRNLDVKMAQHNLRQSIQAAQAPFGNCDCKRSQSKLP